MHQLCDGGSTLVAAPHYARNRNHFSAALAGVPLNMK